MTDKVCMNCNYFYAKTSGGKCLKRNMKMSLELGTKHYCRLFELWFGAM